MQSVALEVADYIVREHIVIKETEHVGLFLCTESLL